MNRRPATPPPVPVRRTVTLTGTSGSCTGGCGTAVPHRYGPAARLMCVHCAQLLEEWRAKPSADRGPLVYGRLVDGVYRPGSPTDMWRNAKR